MKTTTRILALLMAIAMLVSLTACGGTIEKADSTTSDTASTETASAENAEAAAAPITIAAGLTFSGIDPAHCYEGDLQMVLHAAYDTLVTNDAEDESKIIPAVATDWTISDDNLTYVFNLRDDIVFTTGKGLTAADAAYCINRLKGVQGNPSFLLDSMASCEATGDYELTLTLSEPNPAILTILSEAMFGIYDSDVAAANGGTCDENDTFSDYLNSNPSVGSGAFQITSFENGELVTLEKFDGSVLRTAATDKIYIRNIVEASTQQMELEAGDIDFAFDLTADQVDLLRDNADLQVVSSSTADIFFLAMNASEDVGGPLADPLVRQAIRYAIDYDGLLTLCPEGTIIPASIIQKGFLGYIGENTVTRDLDKAKELLTEAGYPDGFEFTITTLPDMSIDGISFMNLTTKLQYDLSEAGITMNINSAEVSVYLEGWRNGTNQATMGEWGPDYPDALNQLAFLPGNVVGLRVGWTAEDAPSLAELGAQAMTEVDDAAREAELEQIQEMMAEDSPYIVLAQAGRTWMVNARVGNIITSNAYYIDLTALTVTD